jgi:hypothetical protein
MVEGEGAAAGTQEVRNRGGRGRRGGAAEVNRAASGSRWAGGRPDARYAATASGPGPASVARSGGTGC